MFVVYCLFMSLCWGISSNALLMSNVVKSALCVSRFELMQSKMCFVRLVSRVFVKCSGQNPCCVSSGVSNCCSSHGVALLLMHPKIAYCMK